MEHSQKNERENMEVVEAGRKLPEYFYVKSLSGVCCSEHLSVFKDRRELLGHLRTCDGVKDKSQRAAIANRLEYHQQKESLSAEELDLCEEYWKASRGEGREGMLLPVVPDLPVMERMECERCSTIILNQQKYSSHRKGCKSNLRRVHVQRLSSSAHAKVFKVVMSDPLLWLKEEVENEEKAVSYGYHGEAKEMKNAFVSQVGCDEHLRRYGLSMEDGYGLTEWEREGGQKELERNLYELCKQYIQLAVRTFVANIFARTHSFLGNALYLSVKQETIERYTSSISKLFYFCYNCYQAELDGNGKGQSVLSADQIKMFRKMVDGGFRTAQDELVMLDLCHDFLKLVFLCSKKESMVVIPLFIACFTIVKDRYVEGEEATYHLGHGADISHMCAALLYFSQCVVVVESYCDLKKTVGEKGNSFEGKGSQWLDYPSEEHRKEDVGAVYVRYCMNICNKIRDSEMSHVRFLICQQHSKCGILDGKELSIETLRRLVRKKQEDLQQILEKELCFRFGSEMEYGFWEDVKKMSDRFTERKNGFWFGSHPGNVEMVWKWRKMYLQEASESGLIKGVGLVEEELAREFFRKVEEYVKTLFWLMQVTSGGPARASEMSQIMFRNSDMKSRNIYMQQGRIIHVILEHKGRDKSGGVGKPIARLSDEKTSRLIIPFLLFVKPLEHILYKFMRGDERRKCGDLNHVFSYRDVLVSSKELTRMFEGIMKEGTGQQWTSRDYRHFYSGVVNNFAPWCEGMAEKSDWGTVIHRLHEQCGHTSITANEVYGVSELNMKRLDSVQLEEYRRSSMQWHALVGLVDGTEVGIVAGANEREATDREDESSQCPSCNRMERKLCMVDDKLQKLLELVQARGIEKRRSSESPSDALTGEERNQSVQAMEDVEEIVSSMPCGVEEGTVVEKLREMLLDPNGEFRNESQKHCLMTVTNTEADWIFVLPTGSGKSFLFMIMPLIHPGSIVIVIVPLVALQEDLKRKCDAVGISSELWSDRNSAGTKLVFCSCEHITTKDYQVFVEENCRTGRLKAIFVDEAHLVRQWARFRPVLNRMGGFIRPGGCKIPVHCLSGSLPPSMESILAKKLHLRNMKVHRTSCGRSNISYRLQQVKEAELGFAIMNVLRREWGSAEDKNGWHYRIICFCRTRAECELLFNNLRSCLPVKTLVCKYHSGMSKEERSRQSRAWSMNLMDGKCSLMKTVMICTSAFGCGIDAADVRLVVHVRKPRNLLSYAQESGRAGRDGVASYSVVLDVESDVEEERGGEGGALITEASDILSDESEADDKVWKAIEKWTACGADDQIMGSMSDWIGLKGRSCRRVVLERHLDAGEESRNCNQRGVVPCDLCLKGEETRRMEPYNLERTADGSGDCGIRRIRRKMNRGEEVEKESNFVRHGGLEEDVVVAKEVRTPAVRRQLSFEEVVHWSADRSSNCDARRTQSNHVGAVEVQNIVTRFSRLCAPCTMNTGVEVIHDASGVEDVGSVRGTQGRRTCGGHDRLCLRCGSKTHRVEGCKTFVKESEETRKVLCWRCGLNYHNDVKLHDDGTFGNKHCLLNNSMKMIVIMFEEPKLRELFEKAFPGVGYCQSLYDLVKFVGGKNCRGHTWFGDIVKWLKTDIIKMA